MRVVRVCRKRGRLPCAPFPDKYQDEQGILCNDLTMYVIYFINYWIYICGYLVVKTLFNCYQLLHSNNIQ